MAILDVRATIAMIDGIRLRRAVEQTFTRSDQAIGWPNRYKLT